MSHIISQNQFRVENNQHIPKMSRQMQNKLQSIESHEKLETVLENIFNQGKDQEPTLIKPQIIAPQEPSDSKLDIRGQ